MGHESFSLNYVLEAHASILDSLKSLGDGYYKMSIALVEWGLDEGGELSNDINPFISFLSSFSTSIVQLVTDLEPTTQQLGSLPSSTASLDTLRYQRSSLSADAKNARDLLAEPTRRREEVDRLSKSVREVNEKIVSEKANLIGLRRAVVRDWMNIQLGSVLNFSKEAAAQAEQGRSALNGLTPNANSAASISTGDMRTLNSKPSSNLGRPSTHKKSASFGGASSKSTHSKARYSRWATSFFGKRENKHLTVYDVPFDVDRPLQGPSGELEPSIDGTTVVVSPPTSGLLSPSGPPPWPQEETWEVRSSQASRDIPDVDALFNGPPAVFTFTRRDDPPDLLLGRNRSEGSSTSAQTGVTFLQLEY
ncbi:hypothetical protein JAAARDRAFT_29886 [Jaapia argillacea MUCL 33604]|uniref:Uncharacterized protein n=1 Tax=Jaapia argillacea MUCL 33604 TaxID=933084 RepID=A0A067Q9V4_9AGAM|nr:hypothetical protein JAAARDRAFT_29886 [Jaapia argillacea MUCL 33604]